MELSKNLNEIHCARPCDSPACRYRKCAKKKRFSANNKMVVHALELKHSLHALNASRETLNYKILKLRSHFSPEQVGLWKINLVIVLAKISSAELQLEQYERIGIKP